MLDYQLNHLASDHLYINVSRWLKDTY